jgi:hypothetical protein
MRGEKKGGSRFEEGEREVCNRRDQGPIGVVLLVPMLLMLTSLNHCLDRSLAQEEVIRPSGSWSHISPIVRTMAAEI